MVQSRVRAKKSSTPATGITADSGDVSANLARRVARARSAAGLTLATLAERSGLSLAFISQIESGSANPTVATLTKIAAALECSVGGLFGDHDNTTAAAFAPRFAPFPTAAVGDGETGVWDVAAGEPARMSGRLVRGSTAGDHGQPIAHPHEEFICVLAGSCRIEVGGVARALGPRDSYHFPATELHHISEGSEDLLLLIVLTAT